MREQSEWITLDKARPGYLGKRKDEFVAGLNARYGPENWRWAWMMANGEILSYLRMFYKLFASSYADHLRAHPKQQQYLTENFAFTFDKDPISRAEAFDPLALWEKPGKENQIHHTGLNLAVVDINGVSFKGEKPLQVREGKPGTPEALWPEGFWLSPSRIRALRPDLIPNITIPKGWNYKDGSIEDWYQKSKVVQILAAVL